MRRWARGCTLDRDPGALDPEPRAPIRTPADLIPMQVLARRGGGVRRPQPALIPKPGPLSPEPQTPI